MMMRVDGHNLAIEEMYDEHHHTLVQTVFSAEGYITLGEVTCDHNPSCVHTAENCFTRTCHIIHFNILGPGLKKIDNTGLLKKFRLKSQEILAGCCKTFLIYQGV